MKFIKNNLSIPIIQILVNMLLQFVIVLLLFAYPNSFFSIFIMCIFLCLYILFGFFMVKLNRNYNILKNISLFVLVSLVISILDIIIGLIWTDFSFVYYYVGGALSYIWCIQHIENVFLIIIARIGVSIVVSLLFNFYAVFTKLLKNKTTRKN